MFRGAVFSGHGGGNLTLQRNSRPYRLAPAPSSNPYSSC